VALDLIALDTPKIGVSWQVGVSEPNSLAQTHRLLSLGLDRCGCVVPPSIPGARIRCRWIPASSIWVASIWVASIRVGTIRAWWRGCRTWKHHARRWARIPR
jgi:hypothetical protein